MQDVLATPFGRRPYGRQCRSRHGLYATFGL